MHSFYFVFYYTKTVFIVCLYKNSINLICVCVFFATLFFLPQHLKGDRMSRLTCGHPSRAAWAAAGAGHCPCTCAALAIVVSTFCAIFECALLRLVAGSSALGPHRA